MKSKIKYIISPGNISRKYPGNFSLIVILMLDHWHAPGWMWGVMLTILVAIWAVILVDLIKYDEEVVDIFADYGDRDNMVSGKKVS